MNLTAAIFAGQGAQAIGMGKDLAETFPECRALFQEASEALGYDLAAVCNEGPLEKLTQTSVCQPAIFTVSACCLAALRLRAPTFAFQATAGLSLGEWTALYAANAIDFVQGVRILEARGRFMQAACDETPSGMITLLKIAPEKAQEIADTAGLTTANLNAADQVVYAGSKEAIAAAEAAAKAAGARPVVLNVAGAYHSPFMTSAAAKFKAFLSSETFRAPEVPVYANATGLPHGDAASIHDAMVTQITSPVRWMDTVAALSRAGIDRFAEFGPGKTLSALVKKTAPTATAVNVSDIPSLNAV
ncbi:MAG: ACP S-malonyltransferase [Kiritimatiellaeota bacterium]|nr:ACP S-malonyltransferase [Kiritimatiellota bacterium]